MGLRRFCHCVVLLLLVSTAAQPQASNPNQPQASTPKKNSGAASIAEKRTAAYFESVRNQPSLLMDFLHRMPKGADLHNHLSGAIYAENFIDWAVKDDLCVNRETSTFVACDTAKNQVPASTAYKDVELYSQLLDAFSMRGWLPARESGHDHFFANFGKFGAATNGRAADMLEEVRSRGARENLQYLELMFNPDNGQAAALGKRLGWNNDFARMREALLAGGLPEIVAQASAGLDEIEAKEKTDMRCGQPQEDPGCNVQARYLYQVARGLAKESVFAQILAGFEMASKDPRVVGLNLVMAEDWYVPLHDFRLHMQMLDYLHKLYPKVHITLHAGELTLTLATPEDMFHIRASVEQGHAERIGHGVAVMLEQNPTALLKEMAARKILVEICLTSNDVILGVSGARHPLPIYLKFGVPVALATDDAGVSRSTITQEYERAVETYHFSYPELKKMVRAGIDYSFLPPADKANEERQLEAAFAHFERGFGASPSPAANARKRPKRP